jgi:hypothetical protein
MRIELTKFTKDGGPLTKKIFLASDGTLVNDSSACRMAHGTAERVNIANVAELGALIHDLTRSHPAPCVSTCRTRFRSSPSGN